VGLAQGVEHSDKQTITMPSKSSSSILMMLCVALSGLVTRQLYRAVQHKVFVFQIQTVSSFFVSSACLVFCSGPFNLIIPALSNDEVHN
jgi:hypothetical protein